MVIEDKIKERKIHKEEKRKKDVYLERIVSVFWYIIFLFLLFVDLISCSCCVISRIKRKKIVEFILLAESRLVFSDIKHHKRSCRLVPEGPTTAKMRQKAVLKLELAHNSRPWEAGENNSWLRRHSLNAALQTPSNWLNHYKAGKACGDGFQNPRVCRFQPPARMPMSRYLVCTTRHCIDAYKKLIGV